MLAQQVDNHGNKSETPKIQVSLVGRVLSVSSATRKSPQERIVAIPFVTWRLPAASQIDGMRVSSKGADVAERSAMPNAWRQGRILSLELLNETTGADDHEDTSVIEWRPSARAKRRSWPCLRARGGNPDRW